VEYKCKLTINNLLIADLLAAFIRMACYCWWSSYRVVCRLEDEGELYGSSITCAWRRDVIGGEIRTKNPPLFTSLGVEISAFKCNVLDAL
jgi:hypothetical protein